MRKLRIGHVPYTNMLPFFYFLKKDDQFEWVEGVPSQINRLLANGEIDMGPISAFAYGANWQDYVVLDRLCVAADGPVGSIFLISKVPIERLDGKRIALTSSSATSVNLIRIILSKFYHFSIQYETMPPDLGKMMEQADAALLIADDAIDSLNQRDKYHFYDVGELWKLHTTKPMVYAVMTARQSVWESNVEQFQQLHRALIEAKDKALKRIDEVARYCVAVRGGEFDYWFNYFSHLRYGFESYLREGLLSYFAFGHELGLLDNMPEIRVREALFLS